MNNLTFNYNKNNDEQDNYSNALQPVLVFFLILSEVPKFIYPEEGLHKHTKIHNITQSIAMLESISRVIESHACHKIQDEQSYAYVTQICQEFFKCHNKTNSLLWRKVVALLPLLRKTLGFA